MADTIVSRLLFGIDTREFRNGIRNMDRDLQTLSKNIQNIGNVIGATFIVGQIQDFAFEAVKLGDQLVAAEQGFKRFGDAADLDALRRSTKGMISDVTLLQQSIQAGNFGIPIQELGDLFAFAQQRAKETGQEVDYLTNSIVTGIGRKSPLILDNLGISAIQLRERLGGVSVEMASIADVTKAVSSIAQEELGKMGTSVDDTTTKTSQLAAKWQNAKADIGKAINEQTQGVYGLAEGYLDLSEKFGFYTNVVQRALGGVFKSEGSGSFTNAMKDVNQAIKEQKWALDDVKRIYEVFNPTVTKSITTLGGLKEKLAELQKEFEETDTASARFRNLRIEIQQLQDQINKLINPEKVIPKVETINLADKGLKSINATISETGIVVQRAAETVTTLGDAWEYNAEKLGIFNDLSAQLGTILQASFNAALTNGESFFKTFIDGLKKMVAQILATAAAAAALAIALMALGVPGVKGANFGQLFQGLYKNMGGFGADSLNFASYVPGGGASGGGSGRTVLRGNDIFVSNSRTNYDISRIGG
jgi:uncharacterized protein YukE